MPSYIPETFSEIPSTPSQDIPESPDPESPSILTDNEDLDNQSICSESPNSEQLNPVSMDDSNSTLLHDDPLYTDPEDFRKIYDGSDISVCGFCCYLMKFSIKHSLTYNAIDDLLHLLNILCPKPNLLPSSIYKLKKYFKQHESQTSSKKYCIKCKRLYDDCDCGQADSANIGHLVNIDIDKPLKAVLSGNNYY